MDRGDIMGEIGPARVIHRFARMLEIDEHRAHRNIGDGEHVAGKKFLRADFVFKEIEQRRNLVLEHGRDRGFVGLLA